VAYSELELDRIVDTIAQLEKRIHERFSESGLSRVAGELRTIGTETSPVLARLRRPLWALRIAAAIGITVILGILLAIAAVALQTPFRVQSVNDMLQTGESAVNDLILASAAVLFFFTLETRLKRRTALRSLHRLRSIVHIVDMHQLSKDPEYVLATPQPTQSSPRRSFSRYELSRYLDYCAELLALASKLAALHVQYLNDPVVLDAVNDIEQLAATLSNKIWQKIMILDLALAE